MCFVKGIIPWFHLGEYSLKALEKKAYEEGFRFRKSKNKIPVTTLHKMLRNRVYMASSSTPEQSTKGLMSRW